MSKLTVLKVGGGIVEDEAILAILLDQFATLPNPKILVHGGGRTATQLAEQLGVEAPLVEGRRITNEAMLDIATMVYGGLVNKRLVAQLQARAVDAIGMTGADLNVIAAHKRPVKTIDYGFAGDIDSVQTEPLTILLNQTYVPVLAPLTHDGKGRLLNTNADTIAAEIAQSLATDWEVHLVFCFEKQGVLLDPSDDESLIPEITHAAFQDLQSKGQISGGMIPKLTNAFSSLRQGVREVCICRYDQVHSLYTPQYLGTRIH